MCELIISLTDPTYWKDGWKLGNVDKKNPKEICQMIQEGMDERAWFKTFSYDRVMVRMPNGNILVARDTDGKIRLKHKRKKTKRIRKLGSYRK